MSAGQKFLFDNAFEAPLSSGNQPEAPPPPPEPEVVEPEISEADLEQARAEGRQEGIDQGREEGRNEAFAAIEQTTQTLLLNLTGRFGELLTEQPKIRVKVAEDALKASSIILRKLVPSLEKSAGLKEIEAIVSDCLQRLQDEPRIVVRVSDKMLEPVKNRVDALVARDGFEGKVVFLASDDLNDSDVLVEWADGGAERRVEDIWRDIDEVLARFLKVPVESLSNQMPASSPAPQPQAQAQEQVQAAEPPVQAAETQVQPEAQDAPEQPQAAAPDSPVDPEEANRPLVSPLEQMGLTQNEEAPAPAIDAVPAAEAAAVASASVAAAAASAPAASAPLAETPAAETPAAPVEITQIPQKPAALAAGPQEPSHD